MPLPLLIMNACSLYCSGMESGCVKASTTPVADVETAFRSCSVDECIGTVGDGGNAAADEAVADAGRTDVGVPMSTLASSTKNGLSMPLPSTAKTDTYSVETGGTLESVYSVTSPGASS